MATPASTIATNKAAQDKKDTSVPNQIPTLDRVFKATIDSPNTTQDKGVLLSKQYLDVVNNLMGELGKITPTKEYDTNKELLEAPLPKLAGSIDFTDTKSIDKAVENSLDVLKPKILPITADVENKIKAYIKMRILLWINNLIDLEKLKEQANIDQYIEALKQRETEAQQIAAKGRSDDLSSTVIAQKPMGSERLGKMLQEETAKRVANGVYVNFRKDVKPFVTLTEIDENSINKTLEMLKGNSIVTWHNFPPEKKRLAIILSLRKGTRCVFVTGGGSPEESALSKTMPKPPDDPNNWVLWITSLKNYSTSKKSQDWQKEEKSRLITLIQEVIGNDPEQLRELWHNINITEHGKKVSGVPAPIPPTPLPLGEVKKYLSKEQVAILEKFYNDKIIEINNKIEHSTAPETKARYKNQLNTANAELKNLYEEHIETLTKREEQLEKTIKGYAKLNPQDKDIDNLKVPKDIQERIKAARPKDRATLGLA